MDEDVIVILRDIINALDSEYSNTCCRENKKSPRAFLCGLHYARDIVGVKLGKELLKNKIIDNSKKLL